MRVMKYTESTRVLSGPPATASSWTMTEHVLEGALVSSAAKGFSLDAAAEMKPRNGMTRTVTKDMRQVTALWTSLHTAALGTDMGTDAGGVALDAADIDARAEAGLEDGARALEQVLFEAALLGSPTLEP